MSRSKAKSNYKISLPEAMSTDESKKETGKKMVLPATTKSENVNYSKSYDSIEKVT